jgi:RNA polymerase sigma-70 factor, ECF subfamily
MNVPAERQDDRDLVAGLRARSAEAFARLYAEHHAAVYNLCARVLCDREEAKDVTQDVFLKAFASPPAADERLNLRAWLFRVATNASFNVLRGRGRGGDGDAIEAVAAPVDEYERARTAALVEQSLGQLNERYRTALVLKDLHGVPPAEIAAVLQISRPAADVLVHRARASFRGIFGRLAGDKTAAPANLGAVLVPLAVPAGLLLAPPLPLAPVGASHVPAAPVHAAPAPPPGGLHLPGLPYAAPLAGPAAGLLSRLGESVATKAAIGAAAAGLLLGGGLAVDRVALHHGADDGAAHAGVVDSATKQADAEHWLHHGGWDHPAGLSGHDAGDHQPTHHMSGHDAEHSGTHDAAHGSTHDSTDDADHATSTTHDSGTSTSGDHTGTSTMSGGDTSSGHDGGTSHDGGESGGGE